MWNQTAIPSEIHYNQKMQKMEQQSFVASLADSLEKDATFRKFHQSHSKKGVFRLIKSNFGDMIGLLKSFESKTNNALPIGLGETLMEGGKSFAYYQYKLFTWICVWLVHKHNITYNQIFTASLQTLQKTFKNKDASLIRYQFFLVMTLIHKRRNIWTMRENRLIEGAVAVAEEQGMAVNWKLISYRLFDKQYLRTPHECRERWINHLNPRITKKNWTIKDDLEMLTLYQEYGQKWSLIARMVRNRNEHMIKNRYNSLRAKWLKKSQNNHQKFRLELLIQELKTALMVADSCPVLQEKKQTRIHREPSRRQAGQRLLKREQYIQVSQKEKSNNRKQIESQKLQSTSPPAQSALPESLTSSQSFRPFPFECLPAKPFKFQFTQYDSLDEQKRFSEDDYEWLDMLIEERNRTWMEEE